MLRRDDDLGGGLGLAVLVADGDLALRVGAQLGGVARLGMAGLRHQLEDLVAVVERGRHQLRGLAAGVAEHDALVARALVLVARGVHPLRDMRGLGVQLHLDLGRLPVEAVLFVADVADGEARQMRDQVLGDRRRPADLAADDDEIRGRHGLGGDADVLGVPALLRADAEERVDDLVRDAVADLIGMAFADGLGGEVIGERAIRVESWRARERGGRARSSGAGRDLLSARAAAVKRGRPAALSPIRPRRPRPSGGRGRGRGGAASDP